MIAGWISAEQDRPLFYAASFSAFVALVFPFSVPRSNNKTSSLAVISSLILQPLSVSLDALDLLAVVVWHRVRRGIGRRVNAKVFDPVKEFLFLLLFSVVSSHIYIQSNHHIQRTTATAGV